MFSHYDQGRRWVFGQRGGPIFKGGLGTEVPQQSSGAEPLVGVWGHSPQKLKKHCKLYTFKKYFLCTTCGIKANI